MKVRTFAAPRYTGRKPSDLGWLFLLIPIMFTVYVLYSVSFDKIYIGYTSDINNRLLSHNKLATKGYTIKYRPWIIAYSEDFESKVEAMKRERQLKSASGRKHIWNIIKKDFDSSDG